MNSSFIVSIKATASLMCWQHVQFVTFSLSMPSELTQPHFIPYYIHMQQWMNINQARELIPLASQNDPVRE